MDVESLQATFRLPSGKLVGPVGCIVTTPGRLGAWFVETHTDYQTALRLQEEPGRLWILTRDDRAGELLPPTVEFDGDVVRLRFYGNGTFTEIAREA
jgi:hypothetical protein